MFRRLDLFTIERRVATVRALWLPLTGIAAAITIFLPGMVTVAAISIIGLPIAFGLLIAPLVFAVSLGSWLIARRLDLGTMGYVIGAGAVLLALALPPAFINAGLEKRAAALTAQDIDALHLPARGRVIAVRSGEAPARKHSGFACDGFCMRALLNGQANRILFVHQDLNEPLDAMMQATSFRLEKRAECPAVELPQGPDGLEERQQLGSSEKKFAHELMRLQIAMGNCLIEEKAPLGIADLVLSHGTVHRGNSIIGAGLDPAADTVTATRVSAHQRDGSSFREVYRRTSVVVHLLAPVLIPTAEGGLNASTVLARYTWRKNFESDYERNPGWRTFLTATLKLDLALRDGAADEAMRTVLGKRASNAGILDDGTATLGQDFIEGISRRRTMSAADYPVARAILTDTRFAVPNSASAAVRYASDAPDGYFEAIAASMFFRLASIADTDDGNPAASWADEAGHIARVIKELPAATILRHRGDFDWLARQQRLRTHVEPALLRLSDFGSDAGPVLLYLIDEAVRLKEADRTSDWSDLYFAGLGGLCRMGDAGRAMIAPIYERLDANAMMKHANYWRLTIETLVGMGAAPYEMWPHLQTGDGTQTHDHFMVEVERARGRRACDY